MIEIRSIQNFYTILKRFIYIIGFVNTNVITPRENSQYQIFVIYCFAVFSEKYWQNVSPMSEQYHLRFIISFYIPVVNVVL